ncbi:MAG: hypothetical protein NTX03_03970 [Bacteroidetes bacterium]|nr:hypothetical protein [Bacteroidota bacterium]
MKEYIYNHFKAFLIIFSILSLTSVTPFWWLSLLSMIFFIWNFFNKKRELSLCITVLSLTVLLIIFNFKVIIPTNKWGDKVLAEWNKTGFDSAWLDNSQESINVIDRAVEAYSLRCGTCPDSLIEIEDIHLIFNDFSYRIKEPDGQVRGVLFYYEKVDSNRFYLAGVGKDGKIKTDDDLLPQISKEQEKTTRLVKYVVKSFTPKEIEREREVRAMLRKVKKIEKSILNK